MINEEELDGDGRKSGSRMWKEKWRLEVEEEVEGGVYIGLVGLRGEERLTLSDE